MSYNKEEIIGHEVMGGWPIFKRNVRYLLEQIGCKLNEETGNYEISKDDEILDIYPILFEDDGMGYGVHEQFIIDVNRHKDNSGNVRLNIFREEYLLDKEKEENGDKTDN